MAHPTDGRLMRARYKRRFHVPASHFNGARTYEMYENAERSATEEQWELAYHEMRSALADCHGHDFVIVVEAEGNLARTDADGGAMGFVVGDQEVEALVFQWRHTEPLDSPRLPGAQDARQHGADGGRVAPQAVRGVPLGPVSRDGGRGPGDFGTGRRRDIRTTGRNVMAIECEHVWEETGYEAGFLSLQCPTCGATKRMRGGRPGDFGTKGTERAMADEDKKKGCSHTWEKMSYDGHTLFASCQECKASKHLRVGKLDDNGVAAHIAQLNR